MDASSPLTSPSATSTGIAAYLTAVANQPSLRHERVWKRFVRVRTDDLESVRVERAIKRVRSDLAAHVGMSKEDDESVAPSENGSAVEQEQKADAAAETHGVIEVHAETPIKGTDHTDDESIEPTKPTKQTNDVNGISDGSKAPISVDIDAANQGNDDVALPTPVASDSPVSRIHRSQSADPDKRLSRAYAASSPTQDTSSSKTGDESSSVSTVEKKRAKKKRSMSMVPRKSQRKVVIDDFEMMRVLGKGCAGKVLLVKQKTSSELYALKAITKRHVLAHQELQHTLTEQAVLKRMAAEGRDPFVVKLWWSFHDKENLFLVMVRLPSGVRLHSN